MSTFLGALLIFVMRLTDQTLGTIRIVMLVQGRRGLAALLGFFESLVWVVAAAQVLSNLDSPIRMVAFAGGFAAGTALGGTIEGWIGLGKTLVRIISPADNPSLADPLRSAGYGATEVTGEGLSGSVRIVFSVIPRRRFSHVSAVVQDLDPEAFVTAESVKTVELTRLNSRGLRK